MKAIVISIPGDVDVLEEVETSKPRPGRHEVLVRIRAVGFNPVDYKMRIGMYPMEYPAILGVDFSGVVEAKGDLVRDLEIGDRVYGFAMGPASNGTYAQYISLPRQFLSQFPQNLSFEEAATIPVAYITAFRALTGHGALQENQPIFIAGSSGGVGSAALSLAKAYRAGPIFTLAGSEASADYLKEQFHIPDSHIVRYQGLSIEETAEQLSKWFFQAKL